MVFLRKARPTGELLSAAKLRGEAGLQSGIEGADSPSPSKAGFRSAPLLPPLPWGEALAGGNLESTGKPVKKPIHHTGCRAVHDHRACDGEHLSPDA